MLNEYYFIILLAFEKIGSRIIIHIIEAHIILQAQAAWYLALLCSFMALGPCVTLTVPTNRLWCHSLKHHLGI